MPSLASTTEFWAASYWARASRSGRSWATAIITPKTQETIASSAEPDQDEQEAQLLDLRARLPVGAGSPPALAGSKPGDPLGQGRAALAPRRPAFLTLPFPLPGAHAGGLLGLLARAQVGIGVRGVNVAVAGRNGRIARLVADSVSTPVATSAASSAEPFGEAPLPEVVT